jgi:predicted cupin superfamily sugar epimerase
MKTFTVYRRGELPEHDENMKNPPDEAQFEGVVFRDGICVIRWLTVKGSTSVWHRFEDMWAIHGHENDETHKTEIVWNE